MEPSTPHAESHDLERFLTAQTGVYEQALAELALGRKQSHWMWFVFPQIAGLGSSEMSRHYAITDASEARAYLAHPVLGSRLRACFQATLAVEGRTAHQIFGPPDDLKLRSSATLFANVSERDSIFQKVLDKYFDGQPDLQTQRLLERSAR